MISQIWDKLSLLEKEHASGRLEGLDILILSCIKTKAETEKQLAKKVGLDALALSPIVTDLMLKGYIETIRRRRLYLFSREYLLITPEGLAALQRARSPFQNMIELIRKMALEAIENVAATSPALKILFMFAKETYKIAKVLA